MPRPTPAQPTPTTQPAATQDQIMRAVAVWVRDRDQPIRWVLDELFLRSRFDIDDPPPANLAFEPQMTDASRQAIEEVLRNATLASDREALVDSNGFEILGCRPYLGGGTELHLSRPRIYVRVDEPTYVVDIDIDQGCQGDLYELEIGPSRDGYRVTRVVREAFWIV